MSIKLRKMTLIMMILSLLPGALAAQQPQGTVYGTMLKSGAPFVHRMHLHYGSGMLLGIQPSGSNGNYAFDKLPLGEYFAIVAPLEECPFSWRTKKFSIDNDHPVYYIESIDVFSVRLLYPTDGSSISPDKIDYDRPLIFRWTPYAGLDLSGTAKAEYQIEIFSMDKSQHFQSSRTEHSFFYFDGVFADGSRLQNRAYQWKLHIYPKNSLWSGSSLARDLLPGDSGEIEVHQGKFMNLEVPKWYHATVDKFALIDFLDFAYQLEYQLSGAYPFQGKKGTIIYDPTISWAHSGLWVGLPIHFGKGWFVEGSAPFFGFLHEMGHDFQTGAIVNFSDLIVHQDTGIPIYSGFVEGFASIAHFYAAYVLKQNKNQDGVNEDAFQALQKDAEERRREYLSALETYEKNDSPFDHINPDMVDGMLIQICETYGWDKLPAFFRLFAENGKISRDFVKKAESLEFRMTTVIAALSAVMGDDLRILFKNWNFPIDDQFFEDTLRMIR